MSCINSFMLISRLYLRTRSITPLCQGLMLIAAMTLLMASTARADEDRVPEGMAASDWSSIRAAYEANRHAIFAFDGGYQARNPRQQWQTRFDGRGFVTTPDTADGEGWSWGLELVSYGRAGAECSIGGAAPVLHQRGQRIAYEWDGALTEWYINDQRGLEHGYTVRLRPDGSTNLPLHFTLAVRGDLAPRVSANNRDVNFVHTSSAAGSAVVNYNNLTVFDANGAIVPAWFERVSAPAQAFCIVVDDSNAVYPLTIDPIAQQAYLKASNTGAGDEFGQSVAISGDTVVVGAHQEDSSATGVNGNQASNSAVDSGAAYVFVRNASGTWSQQAYLKASNTGADDYFGVTVAISGDTVVVGAMFEDSNATGVNGNGANNSATNSGAAYVFVRSGTVWTQQAYLKASNTGTGDFLGRSVSIGGSTVVVGSHQEDSSATGVNGNQADNSAFNSGAAYVFIRSGTVWSQQAYLKASNTDAEDIFGYSVAISGSTLVVGAANEDSNATGVNGNQADNSASVAGAAYVFIRSGTVWSQQAYLKASNAAADAWFGYSVAASGDTMVVGAAYQDSNAQNSGAAYVFFRSGGIWSPQAYLKASNPGFLDFFGFSVAVSGNTVVVGAYLEDSNATGVNGNQTSNTSTDSGAAYAFTRNGNVWSQQAYLKASNTGAGDEFGKSVAVSGDTMVVGAHLEDSNATGVNGDQANNSATDSGAIYVFVISCLGDVAPPGGDGQVNVNDLLAVINAWGPCSGCPADITGDGQVNVNDLLSVINAWGPCP